MNKKVLWIARTAVFTALLIVMQFVTKPFGQFVTGSIVNLVLIVPSVLFGPITGIVIGLISPVFAYLFGIGPAFPLLIPFIALGNVTITFLWGFLSKQFKVKQILRYVIAMVVSAVAKFLVLYGGVVLVAVPFLLELNEKQTENISLMFSYPQLITASIGGAIAVIALPLIKRGVSSNK